MLIDDNGNVMHDVVALTLHIDTTDPRGKYLYADVRHLVRDIDIDGPDLDKPAPAEESSEP